MSTPAAEARVDVSSLSHRRKLLVHGALMLGVLLTSLDQTIAAVAQPTIAGELGGLEYVAWVVTAYILAATISASVHGRLGNLYALAPESCSTTGRRGGLA